MAKSRQNPPKTDIAPEPVIHVPGSWRDASKRFHWVDRAQDFDAWILSAATISAYKALQDSFANKYKRIKLLDALIASGVEQLNTACTQAHGGLQHTRYLAYLRQIAMLAKQMENEMNNFSPDEMKAAIVAHGRTQMDEIEKVWIKHD